MKTAKCLVLVVAVGLGALSCGPKPSIKFPEPKGIAGDYELLPFPRSDLKPGCILSFYEDVENLEGDAALCFPSTPLVAGEAQLWDFNVQTTDSLELGLGLIPADSSAEEMGASLRRAGVRKLTVRGLGLARTRTIELARIRSVVLREMRRIKKLADERVRALGEDRFDAGLPEGDLEACMHAVAFGNFVVASVIEADSFKIHFERTATGSQGLGLPEIVKRLGVRFDKNIRVEESGDLWVRRHLVFGYKGLPLKIVKRTNPGGAEGTYWSFERMELGELVGRDGIRAHKETVVKQREDGETE